MKKSLENLVNEFYTDEQKQSANKIKEKYKGDNHLLNYKILSLALGSQLASLSKEEVQDFYQLQSSEWLTEVDFVLANTLTTLSKELNENVKKGYADAIVLDKNEPEFEYLLNKVKEYLSN